MSSLTPVQSIGYRFSEAQKTHKSKLYITSLKKQTPSNRGHVIDFAPRNVDSLRTGSITTQDKNLEDFSRYIEVFMKAVLPLNLSQTFKPKSKACIVTALKRKDIFSVNIPQTNSNPSSEQPRATPKKQRKPTQQTPTGAEVTNPQTQPPSFDEFSREMQSEQPQEHPEDRTETTQQVPLASFHEFKGETLDALVQQYNLWEIFIDYALCQRMQYAGRILELNSLARIWNNSTHPSSHTRANNSYET